MLLGEFEALPQRHVGGIENDVRLAFVAQEVVECLVIEHGLVIQLGGQVDAVPADASEAEPVGRPEGPGDEGALDVLVEKRVRESVEEGLRKQPVICGREAAARHRGDDVHVIEESPRAGRRRVGGVTEPFHHAEGEGSSAGAAAREGRDHEEVVGVAVRREDLITIARLVVVVPELHVDRSSAPDDQGGQSREKERRNGGPHGEAFFVKTMRCGLMMLESARTSTFSCRAATSGCGWWA